MDRREGGESGRGIPRLGNREEGLRKRASAILRDAYRGQIPEAAIDIEWVIEAHFGLSILPLPRLWDSWHVHGVFCVLDDGSHLVAIDQVTMDSKPHLYRFTLGEELGHHVLHAQFLPSCRNATDAAKVYRELEGWPALERNARRFSAAVLMPMETLVPNAERAYTQVVEHAERRDEDVILKYMAVVLARHYEVSSTAMRFRLREYPARLEDRVREAVRQGLDHLP